MTQSLSVSLVSVSDASISKVSVKLDPQNLARSRCSFLKMVAYQRKVRLIFQLIYKQTQPYLSVGI